MTSDKVGESSASASASATQHPELSADELTSNPSPDERARSLIVADDKGDAAALHASRRKIPKGHVGEMKKVFTSSPSPSPQKIAGFDKAKRKIEADKRDTKQNGGGAEVSSTYAKDSGTAQPTTTVTMQTSSSTELHAEARDGQNDAKANNTDSKENLRVVHVTADGSPTLMATKTKDLSNDAARREASDSVGVGHGHGDGDVENMGDLGRIVSSPSIYSRAAAIPASPASSSRAGMGAGAGAGLGTEAEGDPAQYHLSVAEPSDIGLVSARLVVGHGDDDDGGNGGGNSDDDHDVGGETSLKYGVAEEISPRYCYIGRHRIHRCFIVVVAAAIALSVGLTVARDRQRGQSQEFSGPSPVIVHPNATCGEGDRGNGLCFLGECCSAFGYCGDTPEHCATSFPVPSLNETSYGNATIGPIWSDKICGGYYVDWSLFPPIPGIHPNYNLVNLFAARLDGIGGGDGAGAEEVSGSITYVPPYDMATFRADMAAERMSGRNRTFLLTVGGTGYGFEISNRSMSLTFLDSFSRIRDEVGRLDGLDWDAFKDRETNTTELIWIGKELKSLYPNFTVSASVVPTRGRDRRFCRKAIDEDALDFCTPVFYGGPGLSSRDDVMDLLADWVESLGQDRVVVGLGVHPTEKNFQLSDEAKEIYAEIKSLYPDIRGALNWNVQNDFSLGTGFAEDICTV